MIRCIRIKTRISTKKHRSARGDALLFAAAVSKKCAHSPLYFLIRYGIMNAIAFIIFFLQKEQSSDDKKEERKDIWNKSAF